MKGTMFIDFVGKKQLPQPVVDKVEACIENADVKVIKIGVIYPPISTPSVIHGRVIIEFDEPKIGLLESLEEEITRILEKATFFVVDYRIMYLIPVTPK